MNYKVIDKETYYRKGVFRHFTEDCACSTSMTARIDVTDLVHHSKEIGTKFYINFLFILSKVLNSREDYRMGYLRETDELICYDVINPIQYIFHDDTKPSRLSIQNTMKIMRNSTQKLCVMLKRQKRPENMVLIL